MQKDYIDKGFKRFYNKKTGWHYIYTVRYDKFSTALKELRKLRSGEHDDA